MCSSVKSIEYLVCLEDTVDDVMTGGIDEAAL